MGFRLLNQYGDVGVGISDPIVLEDRFHAAILAGVEASRRREGRR